MEKRKNESTNSAKKPIINEQSPNPLDQFSDVVYQTVDNMVNEEEQKKRI